MDYVTVYATTDANEVAVLRGMFSEHKIDFKINEGEKLTQGETETFFEVADKDRKKARELLHETGYLHVKSPSHRSAATRGKKWMFIFLAALVLILVAILITWFMNAP